MAKGFTSAERRAAVAQQLRDRKGRWIEMGAKVRFLANGVERVGEVIGISGNDATVEYRGKDGRPQRAKVSGKSLDVIDSKASLDVSRERVDGPTPDVREPSVDQPRRATPIQNLTEDDLRQMPEGAKISDDKGRGLKKEGDAWRGKQGGFAGSDTVVAKNYPGLKFNPEDPDNKKLLDENPDFNNWALGKSTDTKKAALPSGETDEAAETKSSARRVDISSVEDLKNVPVPEQIQITGTSKDDGRKFNLSRSKEDRNQWVSVQGEGRAEQRVSVGSTEQVLDRFDDLHVDLDNEKNKSLYGRSQAFKKWADEQPSASAELPETGGDESNPSMRAVGFSDEDIEAIRSAESRSAARDAWQNSKSGQSADNRIRNVEGRRNKTREDRDFEKQYAAAQAELEEMHPDEREDLERERMALTFQRNGIATTPEQAEKMDERLREIDARLNELDSEEGVDADAAPDDAVEADENEKLYGGINFAEIAGDETEADFDRNTGDRWAERIFEKLGYDEKPTQLDADAFEEAKNEEGATVLYRGFSKPEYVDDFVDGKYHAGHGIDGAGTYTTPSDEYAEDYVGEGNDDTFLPMILSPDAKVLDIGYTGYGEGGRGDDGFTDIEREINAEYERLTAEGVEKPEVMRNVGRYAAMKGYDAIKLENDEDEVVVVLNRSKVSVPKRDKNSDAIDNLDITPQTDGRDSDLDLDALENSEESGPDTSARRAELDDEIADLEDEADNLKDIGASMAERKAVNDRLRDLRKERDELDGAKAEAAPEGDQEAPEAAPEKYASVRSVSDLPKYGDDPDLDWLPKDGDVTLEEIDTAEWNDRAADDAHVERLVGQYERNGKWSQDPPVIYRQEGKPDTVVAGRHRFAAADKAGLEKLPAFIVTDKNAVAAPDAPTPAAARGESIDIDDIDDLPDGARVHLEDTINGDEDITDFRKDNGSWVGSNGEEEVDLDNEAFKDYINSRDPKDIVRESDNGENRGGEEDREEDTGAGAGTGGAPDLDRGPGDRDEGNEEREAGREGVDPELDEIIAARRDQNEDEDEERDNRRPDTDERDSEREESEAERRQGERPSIPGRDGSNDRDEADRDQRTPGMPDLPGSDNDDDDSDDGLDTEVPGENEFTPGEKVLVPLYDGSEAEGTIIGKQGDVKGYDGPTQYEVRVDGERLFFDEDEIKRADSSESGGSSDEDSSSSASRPNTEAQTAALIEYGTNKSTETNAALRSGEELDETMQARVDAIDAAIEDQGEELGDRKFYRGLSGSWAYDLEAGDTIRDDAFMSISMNQSTADNFARGFGDGRERTPGLIIEVTPEEGMRGVDVAKVTPILGYEDEFIAPRGSRLRIDEVIDEGDEFYGSKRLRATLLGPDSEADVRDIRENVAARGAEDQAALPRKIESGDDLRDLPEGSKVRDPRFNRGQGRTYTREEDGKWYPDDDDQARGYDDQTLNRVADTLEVEHDSTDDILAANKDDGSGQAEADAAEYELGDIVRDPAILEEMPAGSRLEDGEERSFTKNSRGEWVDDDSGERFSSERIVKDRPWPTVVSTSVEDENRDQPAATPDSTPSDSDDGDTGSFEVSDLEPEDGVIKIAPDGRNYVAGANGSALFEGDRVRSTKDGLEGEVVKIEGNGKYVKVRGDDGKIRGRRNTTVEPASNPAPAAAPSSESAPAPAEAPAPQAPRGADRRQYDENGRPFATSAAGDPIYEGGRVKSRKDGLEGTVVKVEGNGQYVQVMGDDGKKRGRKASTLDTVANVDIDINEPEATPESGAPATSSPSVNVPTAAPDAPVNTDPHNVPRHESSDVEEIRPGVFRDNTSGREFVVSAENNNRLYVGDTVEYALEEWIVLDIGASDLGTPWVRIEHLYDATYQEMLYGRDDLAQLGVPTGKSAKIESKDTAESLGVDRQQYVADMIKANNFQVAGRPDQGAMGDVNFVTLPDGSEVVVKKVFGTSRSGFGDPHEMAEEERDAELLAVRVAQTLGIENIGAVDVSPDGPASRMIAMDKVPGEVGFDTSKAVSFWDAADQASRDMSNAPAWLPKLTDDARAMGDTENGKRMALLDIMIGNQDRHPGNWFVDGDDPYPIDHGLSWRNAGSDRLDFSSPFVDFYFPGAKQYDHPDDDTLGIEFLDSNDNNITRPGAQNGWKKSELLDFKSQYELLKPEFEAAGRGVWYQYSLRRLNGLIDAIGEDGTLNATSAPAV